MMPAFNGVLDFRGARQRHHRHGVRSDLDRRAAWRCRCGRTPDRRAPRLRQARHARQCRGIDAGDGERGEPDGAPTSPAGARDGTRLEVVSEIGGLRLPPRREGAVESSPRSTEGLGLHPRRLEGRRLHRQDAARAGSTVRVRRQPRRLAYRDGFYFRGTTQPRRSRSRPTCDLGPIDVQGLTIAGQPRATGLPIALGATLQGATSGPSAAVVENIGLTRHVRRSGRTTAATSGRSTSRSASSRRTASACRSTRASSRAAATSSSTPTGASTPARSSCASRVPDRSRRSASSPRRCRTARRASRCS